MTAADRQLARPDPEVIRVDPSDVLELPAFDGCCDGNGFTEIDCQALSPDGQHKCYDDGDETHDPTKHWCDCGADWQKETVYHDADGGLDTPYIDYSNLRTPEANAPDRFEEPRRDSGMRNAIGQSIEHVEDPGLRRLFREEHSR
jgi:hypothetical protein